LDFTGSEKKEIRDKGLERKGREREAELFERRRLGGCRWRFAQSSNGKFGVKCSRGTGSGTNNRRTRKPRVISVSFEEYEEGYWKAILRCGWGGSKEWGPEAGGRTETGRSISRVEIRGRPSNAAESRPKKNPAFSAGATIERSRMESERQWGSGGRRSLVNSIKLRPHARGQDIDEQGMGALPLLAKDRMKGNGPKKARGKGESNKLFTLREGRDWLA